MNIQMIPLEGIVLNGEKILLGSSRESVRNILGKPDDLQGSYYYYNSELRFDFNKRNELEFIEFLAGNEGKLQPEIYGIYPFSIEADELYAVLSEHNRGEIDDSENGYSYAFLEISVGIFRRRIPEDVEEMAKEAEENGEPLSEEEYECERKMANYWATIGIGVKGYYN